MSCLAVEFSVRYNHSVNIRLSDSWCTSDLMRYECMLCYARSDFKSKHQGKTLVLRHKGFTKPKSNCIQKKIN